eukprot:10209422-Alexandrium_andersonii.AAC.1
MTKAQSGVDWPTHGVHEPTLGGGSCQFGPGAGRIQPGRSGGRRSPEAGSPDRAFLGGAGPGDPESAAESWLVRPQTGCGPKRTQPNK